jgi:hypothetical protein
VARARAMIAYTANDARHHFFIDKDFLIVGVRIGNAVLHVKKIFTTKNGV